MSFPSPILIIEDDPSVQAALAEALRWEDHPLVIAATVQEAEDALQQVGSTTIWLVIADIHLTARRQAYEGYQLYERWHSRYPQLRFLFMSGSPDGHELPAVRTGAVRLLGKPFACWDLLRAVREESYGAGLFEG
jgi:DNA-binding NtrC family response regulator